MGTIRELDLRGVKVVSWSLLQADLETISLNHKKVHVYNPVEMELPPFEVRGKMKDKRTATVQLLKHCLPRLQVIKFC